MRRKLIMAAMAVMLPFGFVATIGSGVAAAAGTTTFDGNISCNLQGSVKISPAINLTTNVTKPVKVTATLTNNHCIGLDGTSLTQNGETIISSKESLKFTVKPSSPPQPGCLTLVGSGPPTAVPKSTVDWIGTSKITPTVLGPSTAVVTVGPPTTLSLTGNVLSGWSTPPTATYQITLGINLATVTKACESSKGLSKFSVTDNGGDNLEIGPAF
ncbi:MAG: hypothetical protein ACLQPH_16555 [Acidimicrobiales bacterium]